MSLQIFWYVLQKCSLSSPLPNLSFLSKPFNLIGCHSNRKAKFAFIAMSLQIFWQKFYRNVRWVVLYQLYHFCPDFLIWLVVMATQRLNLHPQKKKNISSVGKRGIKLKLCRNVHNISLYKKGISNAIACVLSLLWQLKVSIDLQWEKWKLAFVAFSLQIFWQEFYRNVPWVVIYQTYYICPNLWIVLVAMAT